ncbi:hypothetical protein ACHAPT_003815 [Fusarium lateritium]
MAIELNEWPNPRSSWASLHSADTRDQATPRRPRRPKFLSGWRFGLIAGAVSCTVVFVINLSVTIWAVAQEKRNKLGQPVLRQGRCADMRHLNTGLHLIINALSSVLLAASNYGMQCISAPTRADVDKAHFAGKWLDIGVPSVHNLGHLSRKRVVLWSLLMLSSLPLHLVYNSVVFSSLVPVSYSIWTAHSTSNNLGQADFFQRPWNITKDADYFAPADSWEEDWTNLARLGASNKLKKLANRECIRQYATSFQTSHQSVILVLEATLNPDLRDRALYKIHAQSTAGGIDLVYSWICGCPPENVDDNQICRAMVPALEKAADDWAPFCDKVEYCYSQEIDENCQLTFSPAFIAFVLVSNALKAAILFYIALRPPQESLFVLGDAVESFLTVSDAFSSDGCLASVDDIKRKDQKNWAGPRTWNPVKRRYSLSLTVALIFLILGIVMLPGSKDLGTLWRLGFGAVTELTLVKTKDSNIAESFTMTQSVLLANLAHFVFSGLYFQYNALFTGMLAAKEWSDFGKRRKGLRVSSDPRGDQRSRYFLQLPYRWSIPLILMSMMIHWLLSQSIFIVPIELDGKLATTCGYSPIAIIAVVIAAAVMALAVIITGYLRLPTAMPVVGSCSLGIAAACHGPGGFERPDETLVPLRWGAMTHPEEGSEVDEPGHCGFSGDYVNEPRVGAKYA